MGKAIVLQGDAMNLPLPDDSVDIVVTSPPYFALRSYQDEGTHYEGQVGSEETPQAFLEALWQATSEAVRVTKPTGSIFVNLGDKYAEKSLMGLPWRYALGCVDQLGLILRAEIVWSKPNGLPESVTDRVRRSHEHWFHFTQGFQYFSAVDEIREGRLPGSVWTVPLEPLTVPPSLGLDHSAAFPTEWPRKFILGWSPNGVCVKCGQGRRPISEGSEYVEAGHGGGIQSSRERLATRAGAPTPSLRSTLGLRRDRSIVGYACGCQEPVADTTPAVVLDPFGGTGTTALVAKTLGRVGISVDLSYDYCRLAKWRISESGHGKKALSKTWAERQEGLAV